MERLPNLECHSDIHKTEGTAIGETLNLGETVGHYSDIQFAIVGKTSGCRGDYKMF